MYSLQYSLNPHPLLCHCIIADLQPFFKAKHLNLLSLESQWFLLFIFGNVKSKKQNMMGLIDHAKQNFNAYINRIFMQEIASAFSYRLFLTDQIRKVNNFHATKLPVYLFSYRLFNRAIKTNVKDWVI